jgi:hypothetical protein
MKRSIAGLAALAVFVFAAQAAARPENVRPGHSYYSDSDSAVGLVRDIVGEKNFEEVYQLYSYYEAIYDAEERVVRFVEYVRGDVAQVERYTYGPDGSLVERVLERPGEPPEVTLPGPPNPTPSNGIVSGDSGP